MDEIEQIRQAEQLAAMLIADAQITGEAEIQRAYLNAAGIISKKKQEAYAVVTRMHEEMLTASDSHERSLDIEAEEKRKGLQVHVQDRIPVAVRYIRRMILGDINVLPGEDEKSPDRNSPVTI